MILPVERAPSGWPPTALADSEIEALPEMLGRWVRLATDGFEEFLLSKPFEGLEFGARSYDDDQAGDR